jgi:hypothetical protein
LWREPVRPRGGAIRFRQGLDFVQPVLVAHRHSLVLAQVLLPGGRDELFDHPIGEVVRQLGLWPAARWEEILRRNRLERADCAVPSFLSVRLGASAASGASGASAGSVEAMRRP